MWANFPMLGAKNGLLPQVPIEEAGVFSSNLGYDKPVKSNLLNAGYVAEGVSCVV